MVDLPAQTYPYRLPRSVVDDGYARDDPLPYVKVGGAEVVDVSPSGETCTVDFSDETVSGVVVLGAEPPEVGDWVEVHSRGNLLVTPDTGGGPGTASVYVQPDEPTGVPPGTIWIDTDAGTGGPPHAGFAGSAVITLVAYNLPGPNQPVYRITGLPAPPATSDVQIRNATTGASAITSAYYAAATTDGPFGDGTSVVFPANSWRTNVTSSFGTITHVDVLHPGGTPPESYPVTLSSTTALIKVKMPDGSWVVLATT